jgi:2,3-dihydroxybenzoate-AMP ligase/mycobactin salicyl-AMP ligase
MPDHDLGELVCAYVKGIGEPVSLEAMHEHMRGLGASNILLPARLEVVEEIPLTAAGKADKRALRADITEKLATEWAGTNG